MEAGNLGAYLAPWPEALDEALDRLGAVPGYQPDLDAWVASAYAVRDRWPVAEAGTSLSIPTWFYGHEPTQPVRHRDPTEIAPMVLVGTAYWTEQLPAWPLLQRLAADRPMAGSIRCVDEIAEAADLLAPSAAVDS
jgi:hypothetical protein